jgi:radical SAM-linked protein
MTMPPERIERRIVKDLDQVKFPTAPVTPSVQPIHERVAVEIQRGCTRSCRFCQAGYVYRPRRERSAPKLLDIITKSVEATGIMDVGLLSLSSADYTQMQPLMTALMDQFRGKHLAVSLPSTRLEALREEWLPLLAEERRSGFTIAPEAGSQRLRNVINKNYTEEEVVETARMLFRNGWPHVKMYFMVGLPTETDEDVLAIAQLADEVVRRVADMPGPKKITVSISNFVPKPHTPFQWHPQQSMAEVARKHQLVRDAVHNRRQVSVKCHEPEFSLVDGLVARGDRRTGRLIERAYEKGARFDGWAERLNLKAWQDAAAELLQETGIDFLAEGPRARGLDEVLPWHRISCGLHPRFFKNEYMKAVYGIATEDCSFGACHFCGLCTPKNGIAPRIHKDPPAAMRPASATAAEPERPAVRASLRFQYRKDGAGTYLSTLDLNVLLTRAFARAGLPLAYDQGLKSRPELFLGPALPVGVTSTCELFDAELDTALEPAEILARVNAQLPQHLQLLTASPLEPKAPNITSVIKAVSYRIDVKDLARHTGAPADEIAARARELLTKSQILVTRAHKMRTGELRSSVIDLKSSLRALAADDEAVAFTFDAPGGQSVSPYLLVDVLAGAASQSTDNRRVPVHKTGFFHA